MGGGDRFTISKYLPKFNSFLWVIHLCPSPDELNTVFPTHEGATVSPGMLAGWRSHTPPPEFLVLQDLCWDLKFYIFYMEECVGLQGIIDGIILPLPSPCRLADLWWRCPLHASQHSGSPVRGALLSLFKRGGRSGSEWRWACSRLHVSWQQRPLLVLLSPLVHNHQDQRGNRMKDNGFFPICKNATTKNNNSYSLLSVHFPGMVVGVLFISLNSFNHVK